MKKILIFISVIFLAITLNAGAHASASRIQGELTAASRVVVSGQNLDEAVSKVNPAVVSIVISKNMPVVHVSYARVVPHDSSFQDMNISVPIYTQTGMALQEVGAGSGVIISRDGNVITNKHVVLDPNATYTVVLSDGTEKQAEVVYRDPKLDVAVIKIDGTYPSYATLGDSSKLSLKQPIAAIGNANGESANIASLGNISAFNRNIVAEDPEIIEELHGLIQTSAPITPGYSGGPLIDSSGHVVGINVAKDTITDESFSIPINNVKAAIAPYLLTTTPISTTNNNLHSTNRQ